MRHALCNLIAERRYLPMEYGTRDCCLWAADAWERFSGLDFAADLRGYSTRFGALRSLRRLGFNSVAEFVVSRCDRVRRPTLGAVVLTGEGPLNTLLIAESNRFAWGQGAQGLVRSAVPVNASFWEPRLCRQS